MGGSASGDEDGLYGLGFGVAVSGAFFLYFFDDGFPHGGGLVFDFAEGDDAVCAGEEEIDLGSGVGVGVGALEPGSGFVSDCAEAEFFGNAVGVGAADALEGEAAPGGELFFGEEAGGGEVCARGADLFEGGFYKLVIEEEIGVRDAVAVYLGIGGAAERDVAFDEAGEFEFFGVFGKASAGGEATGAGEFLAVGDALLGEGGEDLGVVRPFAEMADEEGGDTATEDEMDGEIGKAGVPDEFQPADEIGALGAGPLKLIEKKLLLSGRGTTF